jgi:hypothetical protein
MSNGTLPSVKIGDLRRCSEEALDRHMRQLEKRAMHAATIAGGEHRTALSGSGQAVRFSHD